MKNIFNFNNNFYLSIPLIVMLTEPSSTKKIPCILTEETIHKFIAAIFKYVLQFEPIDIWCLQNLPHFKKVFISYLSLFTLNASEQTNTYIYFLPEIFFSNSLLLLLLFCSFSTLKRDMISNKACTFLLYILFGYFILVILLFDSSLSLSWNFFILDTYTVYNKLFIVFLSFIILKKFKNNIYIPEYFIILGFAIFFLILLVSSFDLIFMFLSLEGLGFCLYTLIVLLSQIKKGAPEIGTKYFFIGSTASCSILAGISYLYGFIGSSSFEFINLFLTNSALHNNQLMWFAVFLIVFGFLIKLGSFPGHVWVPDIYEGISIQLLAFFSIVVKFALIIIFLRLLLYPLMCLNFLWQPLLLVAALGSYLYGCFGAITQKKIKRFIAYTSINQIGFILSGLACETIEGLRATLFFLFIYSITMLLFFLVLYSLKNKLSKKLPIYFSDLITLNLNYFNLTRILCLLLLFMAGIPPLGGFFIKWNLFLALAGNSLISLVIIGLLTSVVSTYYYLKIIKIIFFEDFSLQIFKKFLFFIDKLNWDLYLYFQILLWAPLFLYFNDIGLNFFTKLAFAGAYPFFYNFFFLY